MDPGFERWLHSKGYDTKTVSSHLSQVRRVEEYHGSLTRQFYVDRLESILQALRYSTSDERHRKPNPTEIPIFGVVRTNLASYRSSVARYRDYLDSDRAKEASTPDIHLRSSPDRDPNVLTRKPKTLADFAFDGLSSFRAIIESSQYETMEQAVASLTVFTHPDTVRQTGGKAIFLTIRNPRRVGDIIEIDDRRVALDDNKGPTDAFLWANRISRRGRDTQFNHIYASSGDIDSYTALPNICMTPAFMAKLTDTNENIKGLLKFRSFDLYGWHPAKEPAPLRPNDYDSLEWAPPLAPVPDVHRVIEDAMKRKPKDRTVKAARELGWLFDRKQTPS